MSLTSTIRELVSDSGGDDLNLEFGSDFSFNIDKEKDVKITTNIDKLADVDVKYPLIKPFAYAHVKWNKEEKEIIYELEEPRLSDDEEDIFRTIKDNLSEKLDVSLSSIKDREKTTEYLESKLEELLIELGIKLSEEQHNKIMYYIYRDFVGLGKIEPFMHDPYIEDLGCDGTGIPIFAVHSEFGSVKSNVSFDEEDDLKNLVVKLAERSGKYVSYANPLLDGSLPDGSRVNATLTEDVTSHGPTFSIRKFQETPFSAIDMLDLGSASAELMAYMWILMQYQQSMLICGGTATGKTSFLNSTVSFIPPEDKIVSIEDTRELQLPHENWIPSITRERFGSNQDSDVDMNQLLKESFRENPDYVVVGEVRGKEASVLFQGMSSGHPSIGTMHASGPNDVVKRLVTPPISLSPALVESLDIIVVMTHAKGVEKSARRVRAIEEVQKVMGDSKTARTNTAFAWSAKEDDYNMRGEPYLFDKISKDFGISKDNLKEEHQQRTEILEWLQEKGVKDFDRVSEIISEYFKNKDEILRMVRSDSGDYSLEEVIEAEEKVDVSRSKSIGKNLEEELEEKIDEETPIEEKKKMEKNKIAELEQKLQSERKKVEKINERGLEEDPFEEKTEANENPFEA